MDPIFRAASDLRPEKLAEVVALMWLGRGESGETVADWPRLVASAQSCDSVYLAEKEPLDVYLDSGLKKLGYKERWRLKLE